jgi:hypothetical protein
MPTPVERLGRFLVGCNPGPVSDTPICTRSPASRTATQISAPSSLGVTAYLIAFSTSGWSRSEGRRAFSAAGSMSNFGRSRSSKRIFSMSR